MDELPRPDSPTIRRHKRQMVWQIIIPFILMGLVIIAGAVLVAFGEASPTALWRDVSIIWLLFPALFMALLVLFILGAIIYGLARLKKVAPRFTSRAQEYALLGAHGIRRLTDGVAKPFIWLGQAGAAVRSIFKRKG